MQSGGFDDETKQNKRAVISVGADDDCVVFYAASPHDATGFLFAYQSIILLTE